MGVDVNLREKDDILLIVVCYKGNVKLVNILIENGVIVNLLGVNGLFLLIEVVVEGGYFGIYYILIEVGVNMGNFDWY